MHRLFQCLDLLDFPQPVDFEEVQNLELGLLIRNVAPFVTGDSVIMDVGVRVGEADPLVPKAGTGGGGPLQVDLHVDGDAGGEGPGGHLSGGLHPHLDGDMNAREDKPESVTNPKTYSIQIAVNNVPEDPTFIPQFKEIPVSEDPKDQPEDGIITVFAAVDPDTGKPAENVRLVHPPSIGVVLLDHWTDEMTADALTIVWKSLKCSKVELLTSLKPTKSAVIVWFLQSTGGNTPLSLTASEKQFFKANNIEP